MFPTHYEDVAEMAVMSERICRWCAGFYLALETMRRQRSVVFLLLSFLATTPLLAVDPERRISQYSHTAWRVQDGAFSGAPYSIAQAEGGYVWIGTANGLFHFDGVRFAPWASSDGTELPSSTVFSLLSARDGSLWIGTIGGIGHLHNGHLVNFADAAHRATAITQDPDGTLWFARGGPNPLCHLTDQTLQCFGKADGIPFDFISGDALAADTLGNIWIGSDTKLLRWKPGSSTAYSPAGLKSNAGMLGFMSFAPAADGSVWAGTLFQGPGIGLQRLTKDAFHPFTASHFDSSNLEVRTLFIDSHQALWVGTTHHGIYRLAANKVDHFEAADGLSGNEVNHFLEDAEGNIWTVTSGGVDKFSNLAVATYSTAEGLTTTEVDAVLAGHDGTLWIGGADALDVLRNGEVSPIQGKPGLLGKQVTSLLEDDKKRLLIGINDTLNVYKDGKFLQIKRPDGRPLGMVTDMVEDGEKSVWLEALGPPPALVRLHDDKVQDQFPMLRGHVAADTGGGIWVGTRDGALVRLRDGHADRFDFKLDSEARVQQVVTGFDGAVLGATTAGLITWKAGRQQTMSVKNGLPCNNIYAAIADRGEDLWLYTKCGLVEIAAAELQQWWQHPDTLLKPKMFDELSGARPGLAPFQKAARTPDGRLWFANNIDLQMVDPDHLYPNLVPPPVHIDGLSADRKPYVPVENLRLPPLTRDVEIDYTALSFTVPQKVRFRYKLEGRDTDWQEPGTRRQAFYNDLHPGTFTFHVLACNNDGVWNEVGASLRFSVAPAWFQTTWFRILWISSACLLIWVLYRIRLRSIARAISARFDERLDERTRMALELHDTFLQTVQGSKMVADDALDLAADQVRMRHALEKLSLWLGQAVTEGRAALHALRVSTTERNHLAEFLDRTAKEHAQRIPISVALTVIGDAKDLHPIVRDEIARIAEEAIRNACMHSKASQLSIELRYGRDLSISLRDNGVGIAPEVVDSGRVGHFGLHGMRERSARLRARLTITSTLNAGTQVTLIVPGEVVYRRDHRSPGAKLRSFWSRAAGRKKEDSEPKEKERKDPE